MSNNEKKDFWSWVGINTNPDFSKHPWIGPCIGFALTATALALVLIGLGLLMWLFASVFFPNAQGIGTGEIIRNLGLAVAAIIGAPFIVWRSVVAQKQVNVAEQGQITDRINKSVSGLGAEKFIKRQRLRESGKKAYATGEDGKPDLSQPIFEEISKPNFEVRIGSIYALERIAQDSDRDHVQIMEILCAYIRENAPGSEAVEWPKIEMRKGEDDGPIEEDWKVRLDAFRKKQAKTKATLKIRTDIQVALEVIGRRSAYQRGLEAKAGKGKDGDAFVFDVPPPEPQLPDEGHDPAALENYKIKLEKWKDKLSAYPGYRLDLRNTNLQGADVSNLNLRGARLNGAQMQGAKLWEAQMQGADLWEAQMQGADLSGAQMQGADLLRAQMQGAVLWYAQMQGADLSGAKMQGADLSGAQMQGAGLWAAQMQGADLSRAQMQGADLSRAQMQGADLSRAQMQGADLLRAQMDGDTSLTAATLRGAAVRDVDYSNIAQIAEHLPEMFGDGSVTRPENAPKPKHWPEHELDPHEFEIEWRKWQGDPEGYQPPKLPKGVVG